MFIFLADEDNISEEELAQVQELISYIKEQQSHQQKQSVVSYRDSYAQSANLILTIKMYVLKYCNLILLPLLLLILPVLLPLLLL